MANVKITPVICEKRLAGARLVGMPPAMPLYPMLLAFDNGLVLDLRTNMLYDEVASARLLKVAARRSEQVEAGLKALSGKTPVDTFAERIDQIEE